MVDLSLLQNDRNKYRSQHQKNTIIPSMLFCHDELNSQYVLETSETCCKECHDNKENQ